MKDIPKPTTGIYKRAKVVGGFTMPVALPTQKPTESQKPNSTKDRK